MKKSELRQIIREEIKNLTEDSAPHFGMHNKELDAFNKTKVYKITTQDGKKIHNGLVKAKKAGRIVPNPPSFIGRDIEWGTQFYKLQSDGKVGNQFLVDVYYSKNVKPIEKEIKNLGYDIISFNRAKHSWMFFVSKFVKEL